MMCINYNILNNILTADPDLIIFPCGLGMGELLGDSAGLVFAGVAGGVVGLPVCADHPPGMGLL